MPPCARVPRLADRYHLSYFLALSTYASCHHDVEAPIDTDNHGVFFLNSAIRYKDIRDGASHTLFIGEKVADPKKDLGWMSGTRATLRNTGSPLNTNLPRRPGRQPGMVVPPEQDPAKADLKVGGFASHHPGGAMFAFGDGHVSFLTETISLDVPQQLAHRADGKLLMRPY